MSEIKENDILSNRKTRVEILKEIQSIKNDKAKIETENKKIEIEIETDKIRLDRLKKGEKDDPFYSPLSELLDVIGMWTIDNSRTVSSEPFLMSLWDEEEMNFLKKSIMKQVKEINRKLYAQRTKNDL